MHSKLKMLLKQSTPHGTVSAIALPQRSSSSLLDLYEKIRDRVVDDAYINASGARLSGIMVDEDVFDIFEMKKDRMNQAQIRTCIVNTKAYFGTALSDRVGDQVSGQ
jgi:hypothetical protein